jgi:hypothetical protein
VASLTAGRLSDLDFFNNPVSKQFFQGKGGSRFFVEPIFEPGQKHCLVAVNHGIRSLAE